MSADNPVMLCLKCWEAFKLSEVEIDEQTPRCPFCKSDDLEATE
jgi:Zn finger protein HypA/HybF involved in hydrogenase expression